MFFRTVAPMADISIISRRTLHGPPEFTCREIGETALLQSNRAAGPDLELIEGANFCTEWRAEADETEKYIHAIALHE
jgi:hypothetical protein